jgi:hypothetical protein
VLASNSSGLLLLLFSCLSSEPIGLILKSIIQVMYIILV